MWIGTCTVGYVWRRMYRTLRNYTLCTYLRVLLGGQVVIKVLHLGGTCRYLGMQERVMHGGTSFMPQPYGPHLNKVSRIVLNKVIYLVA